MVTKGADLWALGKQRKKGSRWPITSLSESKGDALTQGEGAGRQPRAFLLPHLIPLLPPETPSLIESIAVSTEEVAQEAAHGR